MILFAFASNMNVDEFATHAPSAKKLCNAYLPGYSFVFNKIADDDSAKANIIICNEPNAVVWGVLIELSEEDRALVFADDQTWNEHLTLTPHDCIGTDGQTYNAHVFISKPHAVSNFLLPYDWYVKKLTTIARSQGLPEDYIANIEQMTCKPDPDIKRKTRRLAKFK